MHHQNQHRHDESAPPLDPAAGRGGGGPQDVLNDRGTFDDPTVADERNDPEELSPVAATAPPTGEPGERRQPPFYEPPGPPTAFGASTVGGAVAAAALAGPRRPIGPDPRDEDTVAEGDGPVGEHVPAIDRHAVAEPPHGAPGPDERQIDRRA
ncbi:hypothetical protein [Micromonospora sp. NPDC049679]|uniref:hypothetical protein n=1 Tax=Micromonospora sp. NPDC049679 TaxID=3155920 RepID=UPI0033E6B630